MAIGTGLALLGSAALGLGGNLISGLMGRNAADRASDTQTLSALGSLDLQRQGLDFTRRTYAENAAFARRQYADARRDVAPWLNAGRQALGQYRTELGLAPGQSKFRKTPGYDFMVKEGEKGVVGNLAALGMKNSGAALKALTKFRTGIADQTYDRYVDRIGGLAGVGQAVAGQNAAGRMNEAGTLADLGAGAASGVGSALSGMGNTLQDIGSYRASGYVGGTNALTGAIGGGVNTLSGLLGRYSWGGNYGGGGLY